MRLVFLLACGALLSAALADAHPAPFSYLDLYTRDGRVDGSLTVHVIDVAHDLSIQRPADLLAPHAPARVRERLVALLNQRLSLESSGTPLSLAWGSVTALPERDAMRLTFQAEGRLGGDLTVRGRLFPYDRLHRTFVNVYAGSELQQQAILDSAEPRTFYRRNPQGVLAVGRTFVPAGVHHILIGPDHVLFLVGLLLLGGGIGALVRIVTAFTVGHSLTLSLAALELMTPSPGVIEPAIALSIVFVGADNLLVGRKGRDVRAWVALAFGLVHGFGFAYVLREFGLPREALAWSLFFFNLGVEVGQLLIVIAVAATLAFVRRRNERAAQHLAFAGSLAVIAAGGYWFVQRVFFAGGA